MTEEDQKWTTRSARDGRHECAPKGAGQCLGRQSIANRNAFNTDFQDMITRYA